MEYIGSFETISEYFVSTGWSLLVKRNEGDIVALLWKRGSIPGTMESNEGASLVFRGELSGVVELESYGSPVAGKT